MNFHTTVNASVETECPYSPVSCSATQRSLLLLRPPSWAAEEDRSVMAAFIWEVQQKRLLLGGTEALLLISVEVLAGEDLLVLGECFIPPPPRRTNELRTQ